ncbi:MAG TPA: VWA domain-containing protein [Candidatus Sulfotelmatobacter sp.]|nr:VWA domain-containing protein [Candidatus Sulfotelmatobacter sp.]
MPAPREAVAVLKSIFGSIALLSLLTTVSLTQTSVNDIHVVPRQLSPSMASTVAANALVQASGLHVLKTDVKLVLVPVSVTDSRQRLVTGLQAENFQVFEGKRPQEIRHFSSEDLPVSVGIILDASGSMREKMSRVREAVHQFCEGANLQDEFFLISFADQPRLAADFTSSSQDVEKELLFTQPKGRTALLDAIYMGLRKMRDARYGKKALLIISDGGDNHSRYSESDVKAAAKESDVMIYAIGTFDRYVPTIEESRGPALLSEIADSTGGQAFTLQNEVELPAVATHIGKALRTQYVLGYRPEEMPHDGKWHKIQVKLRLPRKLSFLRAHARPGYYAPAE